MSRRKLPVSHTSLDISAAVDSYIYKYVQKTMRHMQQEGSLQSWIDVEQGLAPSLDKDPPASGSHKSPPTLSVSPSHDAVLAPFSRPVPDDILLSICAALDGMKESVVYRETSDEDRIVNGHCSAYNSSVKPDGEQQPRSYGGLSNSRETRTTSPFTIRSLSTLALSFGRLTPTIPDG